MKRDRPLAFEQYSGIQQWCKKKKRKEGGHGSHLVSESDVEQKMH